MTLLVEYSRARRDAEVARLRRVVALRAMLAQGASQREVARDLGVSQPAISQQLKTDLDGVDTATLVEAAGPVLRTLMEQHGFERPAVFGSVAAGSASNDSDIDLLVDSPRDASSLDFVRFQQLLERVLGRNVDLVDRAGLRVGRDDDILRSAIDL